MTFEFLTSENIDKYIEYLKIAMAQEPDMMCSDRIDEVALKKRLEDSLYKNTPSILALDGDKVVGRIEYHFYGCLQDGYRMAYVDWIYVLSEFRHKGIARQLFGEFEKECIKNKIDQYYLIRSTESNADRFYLSFENAELSDEPILRKMIFKGD